jgi:hypothetical protein
MPQHHSQEKVASAGKDVWVDTILPMLDRAATWTSSPAPVVGE